MSDPFRDGMEAALRRSETLEEENELLREEIERIRQQATALKDVPHATPETDALADQALGVLEQLEVLSKRPNRVRVALEGKLTGEMRPLDAVSPPAAPGRDHGGGLELGNAKPRPEVPPAIDPAAKPTATAPRDDGWRMSGLGALAFAIVTFVVGLVLGIVVRW